jgi:hypothetical protein
LARAIFSKSFGNKTRCRKNEKELTDKTAELKALVLAARESGSPYTYEMESVRGHRAAIAEIVRMLAEECKFLGYTAEDFTYNNAVAIQAT